MYDRILVPIDGSETAKTATRTALDLAGRFDATVHAITVVGLGDFPDDVETEAAGELGDGATETLQRVTDQAADAGVSVTTEIIETAASVHEEILDYGLAHDVDLVVMGTRGRTGLKRFVLGSTTERTLRTASIPILTVHEDVDHETDFERILVPTDGSDAADVAVDHALALAAATGAAVHTVHVVDMTGLSGAAGNAEVLNALQKRGKQAIDDVVDRAEKAGLDSVETSVLTGSPTRTILDYADDHGIDLVVMGTHGRTGLQRHLIGSVTEKTVRLAEMPVLAISPTTDS